MVEQEIDKLSYLQIINSDSRFIIGSDDEIVLFGSFQLDIPDGNSVNGATIEGGVFEVRP